MVINNKLHASKTKLFFSFKRKLRLGKMATYTIKTLKFKEKHEIFLTVSTLYASNLAPIKNIQTIYLMIEIISSISFFFLFVIFN